MTEVLAQEKRASGGGSRPARGTAERSAGSYLRREGRHLRLAWPVFVAMSLTHITFQHVYARQLLPAFVLLIPLTRMRVPRAGAVAALVLGSVVMSWAGAHFLLTPTAAL